MNALCMQMEMLSDGSVGTMPLSREKAKAWMNDCKGIGNDSYLAKDYKAAVEHYGVGITVFMNSWRGETYDSLDDDVRQLICQLLTNRSLCHYLIERYTESINDAELTINIDPTHWKAYYRKALALKKLGQTNHALHALLCLLNNSTPPQQERIKILIECLNVASNLNSNLSNNIHSTEIVIGRSLPHLPQIQILASVQNEDQWQKLVRRLFNDNQWHLLNTVYDCMYRIPARNSALGVQLHKLVTFVQKPTSVNSHWCDRLAKRLINEGCPVSTLSVNGDPPMFGALALGLHGDGGFQTLRHILEIVLVRDNEAKNARDKEGKTLLDIARRVQNDDIKERTIKVLKDYELGPKTRSNERDERGDSAATIHNLAAMKHNDGQWDEAVVLFTRSITRLDSRTTPAATTAGFYFDRSKSYLCLERYHDAISDLVSATELLTTFTEAYELLVVVYERMRWHKERAMTLAKIYKLAQANDCKSMLLLRLMTCNEHLPNWENTCGDAIRECNPSLNVWTLTVASLIARKNWKLLTEIFSMDVKTQGSLANYRADKIDLSHLYTNPSDGGLLHPEGGVLHLEGGLLLPEGGMLLTNDVGIANALSILLLERGARLHTIVPKSGQRVFLMRGRPVTFLLLNSIKHSSTLLDYALDKNEEETEPGYPKPNDPCHQLIRVYKTLPPPQRCILLNKLRNRLCDEDRVCSVYQMFGRLSDPESDGFRFAMEEAKRYSNGASHN